MWGYAMCVCVSERFKSVYLYDLGDEQAGPGQARAGLGVCGGAGFLWQQRRLDRTQNTEHRTQNTEQQHDKHRNQECVSEEGDTRMDVMYNALRKVTHPNIPLDSAFLFPASTNKLLNLDQE